MSSSVGSGVVPGVSSNQISKEDKKEKKSKEKKVKKKKKKKKKAAAAAAPSLLSFGDEEEGLPEFQVTKPKVAPGHERSKKGGKKSRRDRRKEGHGETKGSDMSAAMRSSSHGGPSGGGGGYFASSGMYTPEEMAKLKGNAIHVAAKKPKAARGGGEGDNSHGEAAAVAAMMDVDEEGDDANDGMGGGGMPTKEQVDAARRKREHLRSLGDAYIPLDSKKDPAPRGDMIMGREYGRLSDREAQHEVARDLSDDDEADLMDGSGSAAGQHHFPSDTSRQRYGKYGAKLARGANARGAGSIGANAAAPRGEDEDEEDEELKRWENEQIRKGMGQSSKNQPPRLQGRKQGGNRQPAISREDWTAPSKPEPLVCVESFCRGLRKSLREMKEDHAVKDRHLNGIKAAVARAHGKISDIEAQIKNADLQFAFYQGVRDEIGDVLDCLHEKAPMIEEACEEEKDLQSARAHARDAKRNQRSEDELAMAFPRLHAKKEEEEQARAAKQQGVDAFGRNVAPSAASATSRERRIAAYRARKAQRRQQQQQHDGWSSDEEENLGENFGEQLSELVEDASHMFDDADAKFADLRGASGVLESWKKQYRQSYDDAYIAVSVPSLVAPYVKLEMIGWQPLVKPAFDGFSWYRSLLDYGMTEDGGGDDDDPDNDLIPTLVDQVVVDKICDAIAWDWSPLSLSQLPSLFETAGMALDHISHLSKGRGAAKLEKELLRRVRREVDAHGKFPLVPTEEQRTLRDQRLGGAGAATVSAEAMNDDADEGNDGEPIAFSFCRARWWRACKLLTVIGRLRELAPAVDEQALRDMAVSHISDNLLAFLGVETRALLSDENCFAKSPTDDDSSNNSMAHNLRRQVEEMCEALKAAIPREWSESKPDGSLGQLHLLLGMFAGAKERGNQVVQTQAMKKIYELIK